MKIAFLHHLSLSYNGGGEKMIMSLAKELSKRHDVEIFALPLLLDGKAKINPKEHLDGIPYTETYRAKVDADVSYVTYHPLNWLNFRIKGRKIAGIHSEAYWKSPNPRYGKLPLIANLVNRFTSVTELRRFDAIHRLSEVYPIRHPKVYTIPNFVDSNVYKPTRDKNMDFTIAFASRKVWQKGWDIFSQILHHCLAKVSVSGDIPEGDMPLLYSRSHVTIVPSRVDTFGMTIVESAFCGTPVITSPIPIHQTLGISLEYANTVPEYLAKIKEIQEMGVYEYRMLCEKVRKEAMQYDKPLVIERIENMMKDVANIA